MGDYLNKKHLEILLSKFEKLIDEVYVFNKHYWYLLPKENADDEIRFFETQEFRPNQMQNSIQRFLVMFITLNTVIFQFPQNNFLN